MCYLEFSHGHLLPFTGSMNFYTDAILKAFTDWIVTQYFDTLSVPWTGM